MMLSRFGWVFLIGVLFFVQPLSVNAQSTETTDAWDFAEARQFDFWIGNWDVNLRMIQPDLSWKDSVNAKVEIYPILDGKAILELWDSPSIKGFSLRYYDTEKKKWVLYLNWPGNSRSSSVGSLEGEFRHGRGEFFSGSGKQISRYTFCDISPTSLRWDDAYSKDGGKTWTNNWIMEFSRTAQKPVWPRGDEAHTWSGGGRCKGKPFDHIDKFVGDWEGELDFSASGGGKGNANMKVYRVLGGCTIIRFLEFPVNDKVFRQFELLTWNASKQKFESLRLDNQPDKPAELFTGTLEGEWMMLFAKSEVDGKAVTFRNQMVVEEDGTFRVALATKTDDGEWQPAGKGAFDKKVAEKVEGDQVINKTCPRSGKLVSSDSLTKYRGRTVGFCNTHCRDDFAENVNERPKDRSFFDKIIDN